MTRFEKEVVTTTYKTVFQAFDGTEFNSEEQCKEYESSAKCAARSRFVMTKCVNSGVLADILKEWDSDYFIFEPKSEEEIKSFIQFCKLCGCEVSTESRCQGRTYPLASEIEVGKKYIVEENCDGDFYLRVPEWWCNYFTSEIMKALEPKQEEKTE